jgi:hypothetical protein
MTDSRGLSWEAQEVLQRIKSFNRLPGAGIPLIQLNMRVGSAKTVKKGTRGCLAHRPVYYFSDAVSDPRIIDKLAISDNQRRK